MGSGVRNTKENSCLRRFKSTRLTQFVQSQTEEIMTGVWAEGQKAGGQGWMGVRQG